VQGHFTVTAHPDPLGAPEHHKTITKKNGANDTYTLNLNVTGKRSSTSQTVSQPVDIALVLDNSGSMAYCMNGHQPSFFDPCGGDNVVRSAALKAAVTTFLNGVDTQNKTIANAANKVQVSLVSFAKSASTLSELTSDVTTLKKGVDSLNPEGATNTAAGFSKAKSTLDKDTRTNAIKYVVFFTDGVPTTDRTFNSTVANKTLTTAKQLKDANVGVYSVGIFSGANTSVTSCNRRSDETCKANVFMNAVSSNYPNYGSVAWDNSSGVTLSGGSNKGYYKTASTASELSKVFEDIQQTITTTNGYTGVTIQDTLSEYAEFADAKPAETAKVVTNDGANVTAGWNINVSGKTITASPKSTEPLPNGVTYTLQFDIKPTQKAYDDYAASKNDRKDGYNGVIGSADSDAAGNATSAGKPGFYTNGSACLAYSGDGETHDCSDTPYTEHPVDQVKTGAITVQKKWVDA
ncbi:vWA domain-containing protein, partial [Bifidobacterium adolescentis]